MNKIYLLDTNVLLHDPRSLSAFGDNEVVIPLVVLDELDKKKDGFTEVAKNARVTVRALDQLRLKGNLSIGVQNECGGTLRIEITQYPCPAGLELGRVDNRIIGVAAGLMAREEADGTNRKLTLISKDINLRIKCDAVGILTEDYNADFVADSPDELYTGIVEITACSKDINLIHAGQVIETANYGEFYPNQYVHMVSDGNVKHSCLARNDNGTLVKIISPGSIWGISSRNKEQACALDALLNPDIKLVTMIGIAGSGKTLLAATAGVYMLLEKNVYKKMVMTRPVISMGKDLGYLPGDLADKLKPWIMPLEDNLELIFSNRGQDYLDMQYERGTIQVEALSYIRGRSIPNSYFILDEAQNLSSHEVKTAITRIGDGSKIVLSGDIRQIDTDITALNNGLSCVVEKFKDQPIAAHLTLRKGERSELATIAAELL